MATLRRFLGLSTRLLTLSSLTTRLAAAFGTYSSAASTASPSSLLLSRCRPHAYRCRQVRNRTCSRASTALSGTASDKRDIVNAASDHSAAAVVPDTGTGNPEEELNELMNDADTEWNDLLPYSKWSHNSIKVVVPERDDNRHNGNDGDGGTTASDRPTHLFHPSRYRNCLQNTVDAARELDKSSIWVEVPMNRASLIEDMVELGFEFHHAQGTTANLNLWLKDSESKVPEFATHHLGVGAVVVNSKDEILCVRELRRNFMPWKVPGGLAELGEHIADAAEREVMEETGVPTRFHSILSFRHTHGLSNNRSDLYFVCRLDPIEERDENGQPIIPEPVPQECEIESAAWVPLAQYKDMVRGNDGGTGHPMMSHVMDVMEQGRQISKRNVHSVVPGRKPNPMYHPDVSED